MSADLPPQTETQAPIPESKSDESTFDLAKEFETFEELFDLQETNAPVSEESSSSLKESETKPREDGREVIPLMRNSQTLSSQHISRVSYTRNSAEYGHRDTTKTIYFHASAEKTIADYAARMKVIAENSPSSNDLGNFVNLHKYYTQGVVAINPDGTEVVSPLGSQEEIQALKDKAKAKALELLSGKEHLTLFDVKNIDAFSAILPEKERNEFIANKAAIAKNAKSMFAEPERKAKNPGKFKTWFKNLFHKKEKAAPAPAIKASVAEQPKIAEQPVKTAKPWYETFNFDTEHPMDSIQSWCEKTGKTRLSNEQYEMAKSRLPAEYKEVAANQQYKDNQTAKAAAQKQKSSSYSMAEGWNKNKQNSAHRMALRSVGNILGR